jgi:hypothetical protein
MSECYSCKECHNCKNMFNNSLLNKCDNIECDNLLIDNSIKKDKIDLENTSLYKLVKINTYYEGKNVIVNAYFPIKNNEKDSFDNKLKLELRKKEIEDILFRRKQWEEHYLYMKKQKKLIRLQENEEILRLREAVIYEMFLYFNTSG